MAGFAMCAACRAEYEDPADRRFHAQPIACPDCGPRLELHTPGGDRHPDPLRGARELLAAGRIVAVKGLGGYHLACDARNADAVAELRARKRRGGKPFAVMVADLDTARRLVTMTDDEERLLTGVRHPIVLLPRRAGGDVAAAVAPGNPDLGIMLPYTPLHVLLLGLPGDPTGPDALVMTSGNLAGEPIAYDDADAARRLAPLADAFLRHDRAIRVPCDDSVSRHAAGAELPIRRSRGHAPMPLALPFEVPPTLAVGADLKNACALGARPVRLGQPAHRRHGRPEHHRRPVRHRGTPRTAHRGAPRDDRGGPAPRLPLHRLGPRPRRRHGRCGWCSTTTRTSPRSWPSTASASTSG
nr:hypothetical protein GCM10020092_082470 [Actinoplanes digitatis]